MAVGYQMDGPRREPKRGANMGRDLLHGVRARVGVVRPDAHGPQLQQTVPAPHVVAARRVGRSHTLGRGGRREDGVLRPVGFEKPRHEDVRVHALRGKRTHQRIGWAEGRARALL